MCVDGAVIKLLIAKFISLDTKGRGHWGGTNSHM